MPVEKKHHSYEGLPCLMCRKPRCACGQCHACQKSWKVGPAARTQKGIGLEVLHPIFSASVLDVHLIAQEEKDFDLLDTAHVNFPVFARPCPSSPKHGYIDSRPVANIDAAKKLLKEVLADDPKGELMLTQLINAKYNMIWTPGSLVIGPGHDGATAGKHTITIPLSGLFPAAFDKETLKEARIGTSDAGAWPYVEAVIRKDGVQTKYNPETGSYVGITQPAGAVVLTQLRAGPEIAGVGGDYIPKAVTVEKVIKADPEKYKDRDWEVLIDKVAKEEGVVVWHPGGALTDHFSIHSFTHKIPIIFGEEPAVGQILEPVEGHSQDFDPASMLLGVMAGEKVKLFPRGGWTASEAEKEKERENCAAAVNAMLIALHNATAMTGENSKWIGMACSIMLRLGVSALRGEARHLVIKAGVAKPDRQSIYKAGLKLSLSRHRAAVNRLVNIFRYGKWPSSGYGGPKWATCGAATVGLFNGIRDLAANPTPENASALVRRLNVAVNQAHNGGWWLNKFSSGDAFNEIQKAELLPILQASEIIYEAGQVMGSIVEADFKKAVTTYAKWPDTNLRPPRVESVKLTYQPGVGAVGLQLKTRLLGDKCRMILAPASKVIEALEAYVGKDTFLVETDDGFKVEVRHPEKGTFVLWQDEPYEKKAEKFADSQKKKG